MGLANLYQPAPGKDGWTLFWFYNWIDHQEIQQAVQAKTGINNTIYVMQPWQDEISATLLEQHQQFHNDMNNAIGTSGGNDYSSWDFSNPEASKAMANAHFLEHCAIHQALGLS